MIPTKYRQQLMIKINILLKITLKYFKGNLNSLRLFQLIYIQTFKS